MESKEVQNAAQAMEEEQQGIRTREQNRPAEAIREYQASTMWASIKSRVRAVVRTRQMFSEPTKVESTVKESTAKGEIQ
jgi:hypothetical protein